MTELLELFDTKYFGNTTGQWLIASAVFLAVFFGLLLIRRIIRSQYTKVAATPKTEFIELPLLVASHTTLLFIVITSLFAGAQWLSLPPPLSRLALTIFTINA